MQMAFRTIKRKWILTPRRLKNTSFPTCILVAKYHWPSMPEHLATWKLWGSCLRIWPLWYIATIQTTVTATEHKGSGWVGERDETECHCSYCWGQREEEKPRVPHRIGTATSQGTAGRAVENHSVLAPFCRTESISSSSWERLSEKNNKQIILPPPNVTSHRLTMPITIQPHEWAVLSFSWAREPWAFATFFQLVRESETPWLMQYTHVLNLMLQYIPMWNKPRGSKPSMWRNPDCMGRWLFVLAHHSCIRGML